MTHKYFALIMVGLVITGCKSPRQDSSPQDIGLAHTTAGDHIVKYNRTRDEVTIVVCADRILDNACREDINNPYQKIKISLNDYLNYLPPDTKDYEISSEGSQALGQKIARIRKAADAGNDEAKELLTQLDEIKFNLDKKLEIKNQLLTQGIQLGEVYDEILPEYGHLIEPFAKELKRIEDEKRAERDRQEREARAERDRQEREEWERRNNQQWYCKADCRYDMWVGSNCNTSTSPQKFTVFCDQKGPDQNSALKEANRSCHSACLKELGRPPYTTSKCGRPNSLGIDKVKCSRTKRSIYTY